MTFEKLFTITPKYICNMCNGNNSIHTWNVITLSLEIHF